MELFKRPRRPRGLSHEKVSRILGEVIRNADERTLDGIVRELVRRGIDPLAWKKMEIEQAMHHLRCEIVRKYMRDIKLQKKALGGNRIRRFQSIEVTVRRPGEEQDRELYLWVDVGALLVAGTHATDDDPDNLLGRQQITDTLTLVKSQKDALVLGLTVVIAGIEGVIKLVNDEHIIFQPSLLGEDEETKGAA